MTPPCEHSGSKVSILVGVLMEGHSKHANSEKTRSLALAQQVLNGQLKMARQCECAYLARANFRED